MFLFFRTDYLSSCISFYHLSTVFHTIPALISIFKFKSEKDSLARSYCAIEILHDDQLQVAEMRGRQSCTNTPLQVKVK